MLKDIRSVYIPSNSPVDLLSNSHKAQPTQKIGNQNPIPTMQPHEILACVELALYVGILGPATFCTIYYLLKRQTAWLYLQAFVTGMNTLYL